MPARWTISNWPQCIRHLFLSHCAEDRSRLVYPVYDELGKNGVVPWIDRHHYPLGRDPHDVLREEILQCRHIVYFVTSSALKQGRGWMSAERAYGTLLQQALRFDGLEVGHVELPLFFIPPDHSILQRSIWRSLYDRGIFYHQSRRPRQSRTDWAVQQIERFVRQEERWARQIAELIQNDPLYREHFQIDEHLLRRIMGSDPPSVYPS